MPCARKISKISGFIQFFLKRVLEQMLFVCIAFRLHYVGYLRITGKRKRKDRGAAPVIELLSRALFLRDS